MISNLFFLEQGALWALLLLAVVILLFLLRMPRRRMPISSTVYLRRYRLGVTVKKWRAWRTLLACLLQFVVLGLLCLSAARPILSSGRMEEKRVILVMDVSASMETREEPGGPTRFEQAQARARDIVRRMEYSDRMLIIAADQEARIVQQFEKDRGTLYRTINAMQPGLQSTSLDAVLELVQEVARPQEDPEIFLVSDFAAGVDAERYRELLAGITPVSVGGASGNVGLIGFSARRNMDSERDFSVLVLVQNTFAEPRRMALRVSIGDNTLDFRELTVAAGQTHVEAFEKTLLVGGRLQAELTILDENVHDPLPQDNRAYEWVPKIERLNVLVVAPEDDLGGYLDAAMSANIGVRGYRVQPDSYSSAYDVSAMIFYNWLPEQLPDTHIVYVNTRGENPSAAVATEAVLRPVMRTWDRTHPLMNYISLENLLLSEVLRVKGSEWMEPVARTVQTPIILAGRRGHQKIVFIGFDPNKSDFPFRLAFPALLSNSLLWFTQEEVSSSKTQIGPGEVYEIRIPPAVEDPPAELVVTDPRQEKLSVEVTGRSALCTETILPGIYTYELAGRSQGFAVNLMSSEESDLRPRPETIQAFPEPELAAAAPVIEREVWKLLNGIVFALLCVEAYLYHHRILF